MTLEEVKKLNPAPYGIYEMRNTKDKNEKPHIVAMFSAPMHCYDLTLQRWFYDKQVEVVYEFYSQTLYIPRKEKVIRFLKLWGKKLAKTPLRLGLVILLVLCVIATMVQMFSIPFVWLCTGEIVNIYRVGVWYGEMYDKVKKL